MIGTITPQSVLIFIILRICCLFFYMRKINFVDDMRQVESCMKVFLQDYWFCTCNILGFLHFYSDSVTTRVPSLTSEKISSNFIQPLQLSVSNWRKLSHMKSLIFSIAIYWSLELIFLPPWQKSSGKSHLRLYDRICANINTNLPLFEKTVTCLKTLLES